MEILIPKKNVVLDATILSTLMSCARLTDYRFNYNFIPISGKANSLSVGILIHKILEVYYTAILTGHSKSEAQILGMQAGEDYYKSDECENVPDSNVLDEQKKIKYVGYDHIILTMTQYFTHYKNDFWSPIESERVHSEIIYEDDEIRLLWKAKLDCLMDTYHGIIPMDHKTMKMKRNIINLNNQFMGQCVIAKTRTIVIDRIGFQKSLEPAEKFTRESITYSIDRLQEWTQIAGYYAKLYANYHADGYWPPNFTHCDKFSGCIMRGICEQDRGMRNEELKLHFKVGDKWDVDNEEEN